MCCRHLQGERSKSPTEEAPIGLFGLFSFILSSYFKNLLLFPLSKAQEDCFDSIICTKMELQKCIIQIKTGIPP